MKMCSDLNMVVLKLVKASRDFSREVLTFVKIIWILVGRC